MYHAFHMLSILAPRADTICLKSMSEGLSGRELGNKEAESEIERVRVHYIFILYLIKQSIYLN